MVVIGIDLMRIGIRMRSLIIKVVVFLSMALVAVIGIRFVPLTIAPIIMTMLVILVVLANRIIDRRVMNVFGSKVLSLDNYIIYEKGIYVRPLDLFYPWNDLISANRNGDSIVLSFNDDTEITLPVNSIEGLRNCECWRLLSK